MAPVTTSKAPVTNSVALVPSSVALVPTTSGDECHKDAANIDSENAFGKQDGTRKLFRHNQTLSSLDVCSSSVPASRSDVALLRSQLAVT